MKVASVGGRIILMHSPVAHLARVNVLPVQCRVNPGTLDTVAPRPLLRQWFVEGPPESILLDVAPSGNDLRPPIQIWYCPISLRRGGPVNFVTQYITHGLAEKPWCGPVVALKFNGPRRRKYIDASTADIKALASYFRGYV